MKEFSKEEIEQFKKDLYDELIKMGEKEVDARKICYPTNKVYNDCWTDIMNYNTPKSYAEIMML